MQCNDFFSIHSLICIVITNKETITFDWAIWFTNLRKYTNMQKTHEITVLRHIKQILYCLLVSKFKTFKLTCFNTNQIASQHILE